MSHFYGALCISDEQFDVVKFLPVLDVVVQAGITSLNLWQSTLHNSNATVLFHSAGALKVGLHYVSV